MSVYLSVRDPMHMCIFSMAATRQAARLSIRKTSSCTAEQAFVRDVEVSLESAMDRVLLEME